MKRTRKRWVSSVKQKNVVSFSNFLKYHGVLILMVQIEDIIFKSQTSIIMLLIYQDHDLSTAICSEASWLNGVGYASVEGYPEKFAMCYRGLHNVMTVSYKTCPFGQQWSQKDMTCIQSYRQETTTGRITIESLFYMYAY